MKVLGIILVVFGAIILYPEIVNLAHVKELENEGVFAQWIAGAVGYARAPDKAKAFCGMALAAAGAFAIISED